MKKLVSLVLSLSLLAPVAGIAAPGWHDGGRGGHGWGGGGPGWGGHGWGGPHRGARFDFLPGVAATVLVAGLTYYVLDGIYYQRQENQYVVVDAPPQPQVYAAGGMSGNMTVLDLNGERYYVNQGHYYRRNINGQYLEVPRPAGL